ncbi:tripartite motif-containing protein 16-like protein-like [Scleropages formosus]|uniref:Tripartite motif-containing protein 16-like protein-like n=1 Tax=Scleropages formosus TaxID=113540 RepID=A0A0P7V7U3_SCLFO|nr:tripartite motif-containing protein 16-like protein-like [Scleropages formosus]
MADAVAKCVPPVQDPVSPIERVGALRLKHGFRLSAANLEKAHQNETLVEEGYQVTMTDGQEGKVQASCSSKDTGTLEEPVPPEDPKNPTELPTQEPPQEELAGPKEVMCDSCIETPHPAVKSCLTCLVSYCQDHLRPHLESARFQKHRLVEPLRDLEGPTCEGHHRPLELYCHVDGCCVCQECADKDHRNHPTTPLGEARQEIEKELLQKQAELIKMLTAAENAIIKLQNNTNSIKKSVAEVSVGVDQQFLVLQAAVEEAQRGVREVLAGEEQQALRKAEGIRGHLEQKTTELRRILAQVDKLNKNTSNVDFLQVCDISLPGVYIDLTGRLAAFSHVVVECTQELCSQLLSSYTDKLADMCKSDASNLTFNLNTAHMFLRLTKENQKVANTTPWQHSYPDVPERFEHWRQVLTVESFYLGRHYFEVEARGEGVHVGLTYNSINRKSQGSSGCITGNDFSWCLQWKGRSFSAWHADVETPLLEDTFARVGIYVDYDGGTLAFYGVANGMILIHKYQAEFLEPLYPAFWLPKKESAVLICDPREALPQSGSTFMSPPSTPSSPLVPHTPLQ